LLSRIVSKVYKHILESGADFLCLPPDNNARAKSIAEFLGIAESAAFGLLRPCPNPGTQKIREYKFSEYRRELLPLITEFDFRLERAWRIFKRLYRDDGYSLLGYLEPSDVSLAVSLAPDLRGKYTLLSYMKDTGLLDEFITDI
jgi:hypothetical protein